MNITIIIIIITIMAQSFPSQMKKNEPSTWLTKHPTDFVIVPFLVCWFLLLSSWSLWKKIHWCLKYFSLVWLFHKFFDIHYFYLVIGRTPFFSNIQRTWTCSFIFWWLNWNTLFFALNNWTSNFKPNRAFTRFTKLLIELTRTSFFRTSIKLESVHILVIEL